MIHITELMDSLIAQHRSIDVAESEFRKYLLDDDVLRHDYKEWCRREGYTERRGFIEYCNAYIDREQDLWDVLDDPDMR